MIFYSIFFLLFFFGVSKITVILPRSQTPIMLRCPNLARDSSGNHVPVPGWVTTATFSHTKLQQELLLKDKKRISRITSVYIIQFII